MTSIKVAGIDILNQMVSPFMFVENDKRVRFYESRLTYFGYMKLLKKISNKYDLLYKGFDINAQHYRLGKIIDIKRYNEYIVYNEELKKDFTHVNIKGLSLEDAINYVRYHKRKEKMPFFSYLYNDKTFIRLSPFYIDVISEDTALIAWIKQEYKYDYAHDFDVDEVMTEAEWLG